MSRKYLELFKDSFDESVVENTKPENKPYIAYSIKDDKVMYTIVSNESSTMYTVYKFVSKDIYNTQYNEVDLGAAGIWADKNIGAKTQEDDGYYFQWGDINGIVMEQVYNITVDELIDFLQRMFGSSMEVTADNIVEIFNGYDSTDLTCTTTMGGVGVAVDRIFDFANYFDTTDGGKTFIKYNKTKSQLLPEDDAATVHMGEDWILPTYDDIINLIDNTTQTFVDIYDNHFSKDDVINNPINISEFKGVLFTADNGNSIFLPAAGSIGSSVISGIKEVGMYLGSTLPSNRVDYNNYIYITNTGTADIYRTRRSYGYTARGIKKR